MIFTELALPAASQPPESLPWLAWHACIMYDQYGSVPDYAYFTYRSWAIVAGVPRGPDGRKQHIRSRLCGAAWFGRFQGRQEGSPGAIREGCPRPLREFNVCVDMVDWHMAHAVPPLIRQRCAFQAAFRATQIAGRDLVGAHDMKRRCLRTSGAPKRGIRDHQRRMRWIREAVGILP